MSADPILLIVASCTHSKTRPVPASMRLGRVSAAAHLSDRADNWRRLLSAPRAQTMPAVSVYAGAFWSVIKTLPEVARGRGFRPQLLIASAGYGLVSAGAQLQPYSATFATGQDSVVSNGGNPREKRATQQAWWRLLSMWKGPREHSGPRTLAGFAERAPSCSILVIASPEYVTAMSNDLKRATQTLQDPQRLAIVSSASGFPAELKAHLVPSVAALRSRLGGPLGSLHARTARRLLEVCWPPLNAGALAAKTRRWAREAPVQRVPTRMQRTDAEVRSFLRRRIRALDHPSFSKLLREYRDSGSKCEHDRFRSLFDEVTKQRKAS
jgi:hypothetical protein